MDSSFRFSVARWRAVVEDFEAPPDVSIRVTIDTAFSVNETSDRSALVAAVIFQRDDGVNELSILDTRSDRWKGATLADATIEFCQLWKAAELRIENIPGVDLLVDTIEDKCKKAGLDAPRIILLTRNVHKGAKTLRIMRLQSLWETTPPAIRIRYGKHIGPLFQEVEDFVPTNQNRGRQINTLDAIALAAGFR